MSQTHNLIGLGTVEGYRIYSTKNLGQWEKRTNEKKDQFILGSGILLMSFLYDTGILALVTDGSNKAHPSSKVYVYDDTYRKIVKEYEFHQPIVGLHYMREILFVASSARILIYNIDSKEPMRYITNMAAPEGLITNCNYDYLNYVYLLKSSDELCLNNIQFNNQRIINFNQDEKKESQSLAKEDKESARKYFNLYNAEKKIGFVALNYDGDRVAVADQQGCYIKIYDQLTGEVVQRFFRGNQSKLITSMEFSRDRKVLALIATADSMTSDYATLHIFDLQDKVTVTSKKRYYFKIWKQQLYTHNSQLIGPKIIIGDSTRIKVISLSNFYFQIDLKLDVEDDRKIQVINEYRKAAWIEVAEEHGTKQ